MMYTYFVKSVDRIVDGDTIDISIDLGFDLTKKERVRLAGIDTPEKRTKNPKEKEMGYQATEFLEMHLMEATKLTVRTEKDGKFGRMLGWLYKSDEDTMSINQIMIDKGYAWTYDGGTKVRNLEDLMAKRESSDGV
jgi:micrococcal nuclease